MDPVLRDTLRNLVSYASDAAARAEQEKMLAMKQSMENSHVALSMLVGILNQSNPNFDQDEFARRVQNYSDADVMGALKEPLVAASSTIQRWADAERGAMARKALSNGAELPAQMAPAPPRQSQPAAKLYATPVPPDSYARNFGARYFHEYLAQNRVVQDKNDIVAASASHSTHVERAPAPTLEDTLVNWESAGFSSALGAMSTMRAAEESERKRIRMSIGQQ
jgi:hypothetical protein